MTIRRTLTTVLLAASAAVILAGCNTNQPPPPVKPGNPAVYAAMDVSKSCTQLQGWFDLYVDQAKTYLYNGDDTNGAIARAYEQYANARMHTLHCYN